MTEQEMFCQDLLRYGADVTLVRLTGGSTCPCLSGDSVYSPQWHRENSEAVDCCGSGRIDAITEEIPLRAFVFNYTLLKNTIRFETLGQINTRDLMMIGAARQQNGAFFDLGQMNERADYVLFQSQKYRIKTIETLTSQHNVAQFVILRHVQI